MQIPGRFIMRQRPLARLSFSAGDKNLSVSSKLLKNCLHKVEFTAAMLFQEFKVVISGGNEGSDSYLVARKSEQAIFGSSIQGTFYH